MVLSLWDPMRNMVISRPSPSRARLACPGPTMSCACHDARSVLGSWVSVRQLFHLSLFLTASRMVSPRS